MIPIAKFTELAHRTASRYSHRTEPARVFYTFTADTLADFHRRVCSAAEARAAVPAEPPKELLHLLQENHDILPQWGRRIWETVADFFAAAPQPVAQPSEPVMVITGYQLREALDFLAPDGSAEQLEQSVCIQHGPERVCDAGTPDESTDPAGLYCWIADYPEEGSIALTGDESVTQAKPEQAAQRTPKQLADDAIEEDPSYFNPREALTRTTASPKD